MRCIMLIVGGALMMAWYPGALAAARQAYGAPRMTQLVTVDGMLQEWQGVRAVLLLGAAHWRRAGEEEVYGGTSDGAARFRMAWDGDNLYFAIEAYDNELTPPAEASAMLQGDCIIIAVDARNDASQGYREDDSELGFAYTLTGVVGWRWFPAERAGTVPGVKAAVVREARPRVLEAGIPPIKLTYELSIPWSELLSLSPVPGALFGVNLAVNDADAGRRHGWLEWAPGIMGIKDPSQFPKVFLARTLSASGAVEPGG